MTLVLIAARLSADARVRHYPGGSGRAVRGWGEPTLCGRAGHWVRPYRRLPPCRRCQAEQAKANASLPHASQP